MTTEVIRQRGNDCYFIPRETWSEIDYTFGEDPTSKFTKAYLLAMYILTGNSINGKFDGMNDYFSKFGLEIRDEITVQISRQEFEQFVPSNVRSTPKEGDLIYFPVFDKIFEIKFMEQDVNFFMLGRRQSYIYECKCEAFRYSDEDLDTGVDAIDNIELENSYTQALVLTSGNDVEYQVGESVYVGSSLASANQTANVAIWYSGNTTIVLTDIKGQFNTGTLIGADSNAQYTIQTVDELGDYSPYDMWDNKRFEDDANTFLDKLTEVNPLGVS